MFLHHKRVVCRSSVSLFTMRGVAVPCVGGRGRGGEGEEPPLTRSHVTELRRENVARQPARMGRREGRDDGGKNRTGRRRSGGGGGGDEKTVRVKVSRCPGGEKKSRRGECGNSHAKDTWRETSHGERKTEGK